MTINHPASESWPILHCFFILFISDQKIISTFVSYANLLQNRNTKISINNRSLDFLTIIIVICRPNCIYSYAHKRSGKQQTSANICNCLSPLFWGSCKQSQTNLRGLHPPFSNICKFLQTCLWPTFPFSHTQNSPPFFHWIILRLQTQTQERQTSANICRFLQMFAVCHSVCERNCTTPKWS